VGFAAAAFLLILLATGALDWALRRQFEREQDAILADKARVLAALVRKPTASDALQHELEWSWSVTRRARIALRVADANGATLVETPGMSALLPAAAFPPPGSPGIVLRTPDGSRFRAIADRAETSDGLPRILHLALDRSEDDEMLGEFRTVLWVVLAIAPAACAVIGYRVARRGLRPLADVSAAAARINASTLGERLESAAMPAELADLTATFNAMLDRLESAFGRISQFSADIAHELRTPLQVLRGETEVALAQARSPEELRQVLGSALEEYARLGKLIETLLFLARADNPETQIEREPLDIARKLHDTAAFYEPLAQDAGVALAVDVEPGLAASLDRTLLQRALGNLVTNAIAHTPAGGRVTIRARRARDAIELEVEDTGRGIAPEHLPHIFDRFYRADGARSSSGGRVGLGLALVKSIAQLHGGHVEAHSEPGRGTRMRLTLPG
jgi:two-component system heavy metal sensor histidine kinase CusS